MSRTPYVERRGATFWYRRRLPAFTFSQPAVAKAVGRARGAPDRVAVSLRTRCPHEARRRAARLNLVFEETVQRHTPPNWTQGRMTPIDLQRKLAADMMAALRNATEVARLAFDPSADGAPLPTAATPGAATAARRKSLGGSLLEDEAFLAALGDEIDPDVSEEDLIFQMDCQLEWLLHLLDVYVRHCAREGKDPATALPSLARLASGLGTVAAMTGLSEIRTMPSPPEANDVAPSAPTTGSAPALRPAPAPVSAPVPATVPNSDAGMDAEKTSAPSEPFSEFARRYLDLRSQGFALHRRHETPDAGAGRAFNANSRGNIESSIRLFLEICGDPEVARISETAGREFISYLERIPRSHGKSSKDKRRLRQLVEDTDSEERATQVRLESQLKKDGLSPGEIEEHLDTVRIKRLKTNTCLRHMRELARMLDFAILEGIRPDNPIRAYLWNAREVKARIAREADSDRMPWEDLLKDLLATPIFREPLEDPGDPLFWAPLLALFAGLRLEEALQLRTEDFQTSQGIPILQIQIGSNGQRLKAGASRRRIPIHDALLDLGLLDLVALRRSRNQTRIFTHLERGKSKGKLGEVFSKRFTYYRKTNNVYHPRKDFHSLRTEFHSCLESVDIEDHKRKQLMGHANKDITYKNYLKRGVSLERLRKAINTISVDWSGIRRPCFGPEGGRHAPSQTSATAAE